MSLLSPVKRMVPTSERLRWGVIKAKANGERELRYVKNLCDKSAISLDIGANRGVYSYLMRKHSQSVIAFEPHPFYANFVRSAMKDVQVIEAGVSDQEGRTVLRVPRSTDIAGMGTIEGENSLDQVDTDEVSVSIITLDSLQLPRVGFMKIDVEGHELAALRGAASTIKSSLPNFLIEAEERHRKNAVSSVVDFLSQFGYQGLFYADGVLHPIERFDRQHHQDPQIAQKRYVNNFMFIHSSRMAKFQAAVPRQEMAAWQKLSA